MDVMRLDSSWQGDILIENYSSMIWTERYKTPGDFELATPFIDAHRQALPLWSVISLRDSDEVMIVYSHEISVDDDGKKQLIIRGKTFDTFLRNRVMIGGRVWTDNRSWSMRQKYTPGEAAAAIIWNHIVDNDPWVLRQLWILDGDTPNPPAAGNSNDIIANVRVRDSSTRGSKRYRNIGLGDVLGEVEKQLRTGDLAIRNIRPTGKSVNIFRLDTEGVVQTSTTTLSASLLIDIYNGVDRSINQSTRNQVVFRYDSGHLINPKYVWNVEGNINGVMVDSQFDRRLIMKSGVPGTVQGLERRIGYATLNIKDDDVVEINDPWAAYEEVAERIINRQRSKVFDAGAVSPNIPYKYGKDYFLGDEVTVQAEYGLEQTMQVAEYIRTDSAEAGEVGYPTLVASN